MNSYWRCISPELLRREESNRTGIVVLLTVSCAFLIGRMNMSFLLLGVLVMILWAYLNKRLETHWDYFYTSRTIDNRGIHDSSLSRGDNKIRSLSSPPPSLPTAADLVEDTDTSAENSPAEVNSHIHRKEVGIANSFLSLVWPQVSVYLEHTLSTAIKEAISGGASASSGSGGAGGGELLYSRFEKGVFECLDMRGYTRGWSDEDGDEDDFIIESRVLFQGRLRIGAKLFLLLGTSVRTSIQVSSISCTIRMSLQQRMQRPPFIKYCKVQVIDDPILKFKVHLGSFDPVKIPSVEHWFRQKLADKIRTSTFTISFKSSVPATSSSGILRIYIDRLERRKEDKVMQDTRTGDFVKPPPSSLNSSSVHPATNIDDDVLLSVSLNLGKYDRITSTCSASGIFSESFLFSLSTDELYQFKKVKIKVNESFMIDKQRGKRGKKIGKGSVDLIDVLGSNLEQTVVEHLSYTLSPLGFGQLKMRFLWEPLHSPLAYTHSLAMKGISNWSQTDDPFGVLGVRISQLDDTFPLPPNSIPYCMIRFGSSTASKDTLQVFKTKTSTTRIWDEEHDMFCYSENDELWIALIDSHSRDSVLCKTKIKVWDVLREQESLSCFVSVPLKANDGTFHVLLIAFSFKGTYFFSEQSKKCLYNSSIDSAPEITPFDYSSSPPLSPSSRVDESESLSSTEYFHPESGEGKVFTATRRKSSLSIPHIAIPSSLHDRKYSDPMLSPVNEDSNESTTGISKPQRSTFMNKVAGLFSSRGETVDKYSGSNVERSDEMAKVKRLSMFSNGETEYLIAEDVEEKESKEE